MNYLEKCKKYVLPQLRYMDGFKETLEAISDQYVSLDKFLTDIYNWHDIDKATGEILDYIGFLWGTSRQFFDLEQYFNVNLAHLNVRKYFYFKNAQENTVVPTGNLDDREFRLRIKAKIASYFSLGARNENISIIKNMTFSESVIITKHSPMLLDITIKGARILTSNTIQQDIESILSGGVGINKLTFEGGVYDN